MDSESNEKRIVGVSIVAANYNNGKYLIEFIESIINSTVLPKELIIVDDGSTDESIQILESYKHLEYLKVFCFTENKGFTTALNKGIDIASSRYIARADPDDILVPSRIEKQFNFMEIHPEVDILGTNAVYFNNDDDKIINESNFPKTDKEIKRTYLKGEHGILHATALLRSEVFKKYRYKNIFPAEDYEIFSRMVKATHTFQNLKEPLYLVRVHSGSSTTNLKIQSIKQTFEFRDQIFGTKTTKWHVFSYYQYIRHYRNYQMSKNHISKYFFLLLSITFYPSKLFKRIKNKLSKK